MKTLMLALAATAALSGCGTKGSDPETKAEVPDPVYWVGTWTASGGADQYCSQDGTACGSSYQAGCAGPNPTYEDASGNSIVGGVYAFASDHTVTVATTSDWAFSFTGSVLMVSSGYQWDWIKLTNHSVVMRYTSNCAVKFTK